MREFVYLDDVSVYSLYASRMGPIVAELTETEAASLQTEVTGSAGVNALVGKAEVASRIQAESNRGTQVLRKSIIQATFKELHDLERQSLVMRPTTDEPPPLIYRYAADLETAAKSGRFGADIIDPRSLRRGALVELEVRLEAEPIFQVSAVMSSVIELLVDNPSMFGIQPGDFVSGVAANQLLDKLLGGLVPLRGRAIEYEVVQFGGNEWVARRAMLESLEGAAAFPRRPLFLTGVAEHSLFWKDIRRVLFAGSTYRIFARLAGDGLQKAWTPVKLVDVLRSVAPEVAAKLDEANRGALDAMSRPGPNPDVEKGRMMTEALISYGRALSERTGTTISREDLAAAIPFGSLTPESFDSVSSRRETFHEMTSFVQARSGVEVDRVIAADCRIAALVDAGFSFDAGVTPRPIEVPIPSRAPESEDRFLDSELVAIYW